MVYLWVDPRRKHGRCGPKLQRMAHLQEEVKESDLGRACPGAFLLNMELGTRIGGWFLCTQTQCLGAMEGRWLWLYTVQGVPVSRPPCYHYRG